MAVLGLKKRTVVGIGTACLVGLAMWLVASVLSFRLVASMDAERQVAKQVSDMAEEIESITQRGRGHVLVSELRDREASLLVTVSPSAAEEIGVVLSQQAAQFGSELSMWENDDRALVHVALRLNENQVAALKEEADGSMSADATVRAGTLSLLAALVITAVAIVTTSLIYERRSERSGA